ncbi:MAG: hypothetical protein WCL10_18835 [Novosphingobium sp.]|uniref:hypothetical protein n=1 Tax=Novosphingobium sp. TaxID=1874826 RepID=UPI003015F9AB
MTQTTEADIRAACEEADIPYYPERHFTNYSKAFQALARRIAAEREAVPVASYWDHPGGTRTEPLFVPEDATQTAWFVDKGYQQRFLYAHPPKEPNNA